MNEGKGTIENILKKFTIGKTESGKFRYCGRQFAQREDFSVSVSTSENCKTVKPIEIDKNCKLTDKVTEKNHKLEKCCGKPCGCPLWLTRLVLSRE